MRALCRSGKGCPACHTDGALSIRVFALAMLLPQMFHRDPPQLFNCFWIALSEIPKAT